MTWEQALLELKQGNQRFRENRMLHPRVDLARIRETAFEQHPFGVVLTCADSRVPPEVVFDQGIGDLFTIRVAGNVANGDEIASIEYAVEQLHTPLCLVLGHTGCGAIQAVMSGQRLSLDLDHLLRQVKTAAEDTRRSDPCLYGAALVNAAVRAMLFGPSKHCGGVCVNR